MIVLNGQKTEIKEGMTIAALLEEKQFRINLVAVEYNGQIIKKNRYDTIVIKDDDVLEIVSFMGGG